MSYLTSVSFKLRLISVVRRAILECESGILNLKLSSFQVYNLRQVAYCLSLSSLVGKHEYNIYSTYYMGLL